MSGRSALTWRNVHPVSSGARSFRGALLPRLLPEAFRPGERSTFLWDGLARERAASPTTVSAFAHWWLRNVAANRVRASSLGTYEDRVDRITAQLGDVELGALRAEQVATMQTEMLATLAPQTVADTRSTFRSITEEAVNLQLIASNPVAKVRPPRVLRPQRRALTAERGRAFVAAAAPERLGAAVALLFVQGWRVSEVLGLARGDIDLDAGIPSEDEQTLSR